jgi:hypothetical protein
MTQDLRVAMTTSLNDRLVAPLRRSLDEIERGLKRAQRELQATQRTSEQAGRAMGNMQGPTRAARQVADLARNTQHATTLAERLERAWNRTGAVLKGIGSGMAAWQAAKYVLSGPLQQSQNYGLALARAGNTAFSDRDEAGWRAGVKDLDATVVSSLRTGGGTRDDVLAALNEMLASGKVSPGQAKTALPLVAKYATASGASAVDLSQIVVRALQAGFKEADVGRLLDMALVAGQKGGFELKDMASWLPKLMAAGQQSGLRGFEGYARILASAEASLTTAGSKDEAGNNLLNLLAKINSADTARDAQKLGIDLPGTLAAARGKGMNSLDAFVGLVDKIASVDPRMAKVRKDTASATGAERKAMLESQADILQGSAIGKIVQDRQALLALVAEMNQRGYIKEIMGAVNGANGQFGATNFDRIASTPAFQVQRQENEKLIAQDRALLDVNSSLGRLASATTGLYQKYPGFSTVVEAAKLAISTLAAAAGAAAGALAIFGLAGKGGAAAGAAGAAGGAARAGYSSLMNGPAAATGAGAATGSLAIAGAVAMPATILGAGVVMSDRMNSVSGLTERINSRNDRLQELNELARLDGRPGKYDREIEALTADREAMRERYGQQVGGGRGVVNPPVNVNVYLDGREMNAHVEAENKFQAGRR